MPYPSVFRPIKRGNFSVRPFQVYKEWQITNSDYSSSGYTLQQAAHRKELTPIGQTTLSTFGNNSLPAGTVLNLTTVSGNDPINNYDGSYQNIIWHSLDHKYYRNAYDPGNNLVASNRNTIEKVLFLSASTFTIPYFKVGESIRPGSFTIADTSNDFTLYDDGKGNLRDKLISSQSFAKADNLVGYWGFNEEFKNFKYNYGYHSKGIIFDSNTYEVDVVSTVVNTGFYPGIATTGFDDIVARGYSGSQLVINGTFTGFSSETVSGWALGDSSNKATWTSITDGVKATLDATNSTVWHVRAYQTHHTVLEIGKTYEWSFEARAGGASTSITAKISGGNGQARQTQAPGAGYFNATTFTEHKQIFTCTALSGNNQNVGSYFWMNDATAGNFMEIRNVSLKEVLVPKSGMKATFDGSSYIKTDAYKALNFDRVDDFAISFWYQGNISQSISSSNTNSLITKRGVNDKLVLNKKTRKREVVEENRKLTRYPFDIEVLNQEAGTLENGKIRFRRSDGITTYSSASATQCTGSNFPGDHPNSVIYTTVANQYHVLAQKSSSYLELWINGVREIKSFDPVPNEVQNYSKLMFGAMNTNLENAFSGSLDEVRIYNTGLTEPVIKGLANNHFISSSAYQTSVAGNVFYKLGQSVISSNLPKYHKALGSGGNLPGTWNIGYKGTHTIWENEVLVEVPAGHCNVTMNPSALQRNNTDRLKKDFTASLSPYITTIGLYNNDAQLLAIGKLASPIAKRSDVDTNFIVRWDY